MLVVGYFFGLRRFRGSEGSVNRELKLVGNEKKLYDILDRRNGIGQFARVCEEYGEGKVELEKVVLRLKKKRVLGEKFSHHWRRLYLKNYLNKREREVVSFIGDNGGEVEFCVIMKKLGTDDNMLIGIGKKLVRMGLILKIRRGHGTYFVLRD